MINSERVIKNVTSNLKKYGIITHIDGKETATVELVRLIVNSIFNELKSNALVDVDVVTSMGPAKGKGKIL